MRKLAFILLLFCMMQSYAKSFTLPLYDYEPTRSNGITEDEYTDGHGAIYNLQKPRLDIYLPDNSSSVPCVLTLPGGGYLYVSATNEGSLVADRLLKDGIAVAVLKYRLPNGHSNIPLVDAMRAMEILRDSAANWGIDSSRIGVMGFSAGGHLAGCLLTLYKSPKTKPDFGVLVYPVATLDSAITHLGTRTRLLGEKQSNMIVNRYSPIYNVSNSTPPCIIYACQDDRAVPVVNSWLFYEALTKQGVPAALHIYPEGGHGWGFSRSFPYRFEFETTLVRWIKNY